MTALEVRVRYFSHDVWIHPSLLGWTGRLVRDGKQIEIRLPIDPEEFAREHSQQVEPPGPSVMGAPTFSEPDWDNRTVAVRLFCVTVKLEHELPTERPENPFDGEYGELAEIAMQEGQQICDDVAQDFLRWLRASSRQPWLGLFAASAQQYGRGGLYYAETGQGIFGTGPVQSLTLRSSRLRIERNVLDSLVDKIADKSVVPVSQALLADAWHLQEGPEVPDAERAVLLAAIASEVRTQDFLREHVPADRKPLLEVALRRTSTLSVLLHDVFQAALDVSLKTTDRELFKRVQNLTTQRNAIVHEGQSRPTPELRGGPALIANDLFAWLSTCLNLAEASPDPADPVAQSI